MMVEKESGKLRDTEFPSVWTEKPREKDIGMRLVQTKLLIYVCYSFSITF
jgi:hypothetical protein